MVVMIYGGEKMEILKIKVAGFRNISKCEIDISKITGLLSINSYGKSNLLKAIEFGIDFITSPISVKNDQFGWKSGFPKNKNALNKKFSFEVSLSHDGKEIIYGYTFSWRLNEDLVARVENEYLKIREKSKNKIFSNYICREMDNALYKASETSRCNKKLQIKSDELIINKLLAFDNLFYYSIIESINALEIYVDRHLDSAGAFEIDPIIRKNSDDLKLATVANIPRTLYKLKDRYPQKYSYLIDVYVQLFPRIESIELEKIKFGGVPDVTDLPAEIEIVDYIYLMFCKEYNMVSEINFQQMSDGAKRILLLLTNLLLAEINQIPLVCIEEPENSINPSLLRKYIEVINDISDKTKILLTSHSPYLVDYLQPNDLYIGYNNENGIVDFKHIKKTAIKRLYNDSSSYGMGVGDYLFDLFGNEDNWEELVKYVK